MSKQFLKILIITAVMSLSVASSASAGWTEGKYNSAIEFNGSSTYIDGFGAIGDVKTVSFWIKAGSLTEEVMDLNGTQTITIGAGTISANGFTSPTIYVDGKVSSTLPDTDWHHIAITTDTAVSASAVVIGKVGADYFTGTLDNVQLYPYARTADEIRLDYNAGVATHLGPSGKTCSEDPASCMDYGLVGSWNMDEGTGTTAYDGSDEGNDGTLIGGPKWTADSPPLAGGAGGGSSLQFDGTDDYVDCGNNASLDITDAITVEAWVNINVDESGRIASKHGGGSYGWTLIRGVSNDNIEWRISTTGSDWNGGFTSLNIFKINIWYHIVATYDGSYMRVYVNGVEDTDGDFPVSLTGSINVAPASTQIGRDEVSGSSGCFPGSIDSVRIYNRALSAEEVRYHYNHGGPVASWNFDEGSGQTAYDSAGDADGTLGSTTGSDGNDPGWATP